MKKILLITVLLFITTQFVKAQSDTNNSVELDEVVVTGTKVEISKKLVPLSVNQINFADIENTGEINILPVLNNVAPGVFVTERGILGFGVSNGSAGSISIRGISGSPNTNVLVLIDGHPQFMGIFGHPLPDAYVSSDVQKVEIIRGPASVLYGTNATGGVINIITKKPSSDGVSTNLNFSNGSFNTQRYNGTLGFKKNKWSTFAAINHNRTDGHRDNTDFEITNGYAKAIYNVNNNFNVIADYSIAVFDANDNGPVFAPAPFGIDITRGKAALSIDNIFDRTEGSLKLYHNFGEHDLTDGFHSTDHNSGLMLYQSYRFGSRGTITAGVDYKNYGGKANRGAAANEDKSIYEIGFYSYYQHMLNDKFSISAGIRLDNNSVFGNTVSPFGGFTFLANESTSFKASISRGFRSPTILELYLFAPNPDLSAENIISYELSYLQTVANRLSFEITGFVAKGDNIIQVAGQFPNIMRMNSGEIENKGIEFSSKFQINKNLLISANYNYLDLEQPVLAAPRQQINFIVNYNYYPVNINLSLQHIDKLYTSLQQEITQNYTLLNARVSARVYKNISLYFMANNILDEDYEINFGYPMPGINFFGGAKFEFRSKE